MDVLSEVRAFWDRRPCNIRHSPGRVGTREYYDEVEARKYFVEPHIPGFAQFEHWRGKKVLEIGCGIGTDAVNFARHGSDLTAVELSERSLEVSQRRLEVYGLTARLYCGNAEQLSTFVPVEPYDLVYSFGVVHHTPHPERVLQEIQKYCKPETEIRLMVYSRWSWKTFWIILNYGAGAFWRASELIKRYSEAQTGCPVTWSYSSHDVRRLMKDYRILEIRKDHIFPYRVQKYVKYEYEKEWYFRWMSDGLFRWLERRLGWHTLVTARPKSN